MEDKTLQEKILTDSKKIYGEKIKLYYDKTLKKE